jgi:hypothetical protein
MKARILAACARQAYTRLFAILSDCELALVSTLADADAALKAGGFNLVMIGLHFDESRMFELLHDVRADAKYERVPVVCFRGIIASDGDVDFTLEAVQAACKAMGANAFFDLMAFTDDALGNAAIRKLVDRFLVSGQMDHRT